MIVYSNQVPGYPHVEWKSRAETVESGCVESGLCYLYKFGQGISYWAFLCNQDNLIWLVGELEWNNKWKKHLAHGSAPVMGLMKDGCGAFVWRNRLTLLSKNENPKSQASPQSASASCFVHSVQVPAVPRSFKGKSCHRGKEEPNHNFRLTPNLKVQRGWVFCFSDLFFV